MLKFVLVWLLFSPVLMPVVAVPNCVHVPELFDHHVAVMVCVSLSLQTMYSVGVPHIFVCVSVGAGLLCVGALLVVNWYVWLHHPPFPSVRFTDQ